MKKNSKDIIIIILLIIIIIMSAAIFLLAYNSSVFNIVNNSSDKNLGQINEGKNTNFGDDNSDDINEDDKYYRYTRLTLIDAPKCYGEIEGNDEKNSLIAEIVDGNIVLSQAMGASMVKIGNAKYIYPFNKFSCSDVDLYYITDDGGLYLIKNPTSGKDEQQIEKINDNNVSEFLGLKVIDGGQYLSVLLENGNVEDIFVFKPTVAE